MDKSALRFGTFYIASKQPVDSDVLNKSKSIVINSVFPREAHSITWETIIDNDALEPTLTARLLNVGNKGRDAVVQMPLNHLDIYSLLHFVDVALDVFSTHHGDIIIPAPHKPEIYCETSCINESREAPTGAFGDLDDSAPVIQECANRTIKGNLDVHAKVAESDSSPDWLTQQEEHEIHDIEAQQHEALEQIRTAILNYVLTYHADPKHLMDELLQGKYVVGVDGLSTLTVSGDMDIVLQGYDELQVKMPALHKSIYILFLKHLDDGIVLKRFADYRAELEDIYAVVKPGRNENLARITLDNLCDPMSDTLNQYLSKIKRCFTTVIGDKDIASHYCITGQAGQPYRIRLQPHMVTLPAIFTE